MSKMENIANHNSDFKEEDDMGWTPIVLRIDLDEAVGNDVQDDTPGQQDSFSDAFFVEDTIDPDFIEVWDGSRWVSVRSADSDRMMGKAIKAAVYESDDDEPYDEWGGPTGWWEVDFDVFKPGSK
jgi:hypothetical protein